MTGISTDGSPFPQSLTEASFIPGIPVETAGVADDSFFNFFLTELSKVFPYVNLFPWTAAILFSTSTHNPALRQSVLAVAALLAEQEGGGHNVAFAHLQIALQTIRNRLTETGADHGLAISSFLLAQYCIMKGEILVARHHLQGMAKILKKLHQTSQYDETPSPLTSDALTILIWRMAIRVDFISSIAVGQRPIFAE